MDEKIRGVTVTEERIKELLKENGLTKEENEEWLDLYYIDISYRCMEVNVECNFIIILIIMLS